MFAIELSDTGRSYGSIHAAGCRDLRDPEPVRVEAPATAAEIARGVEDATGWEFEDDDVRAAVKPCARKLMKGE